MIRKIQYITFCLFAIVGVAQTSGIMFDFHTGELSQTLLSEDIDSITFSHGGKSNVAGFDVVESVWNYSETSEDTISWMTTGSQVVNDMTLKDGKLYVVRRNGSNDDNTIEIVDAYKGTKIGSLNTSSCTTGAHYISAIETLGNSIIACNLTGGNNFIIYKWDDDTSEPEVMLKATAPCYRIGDAMSVSGDMENGRIWFVYGQKVYYYSVSKGKITSTKPTVIGLSDYDGTYSNVTVEADGSFWVGSIHSYGDKLPAHFAANGDLIGEFPNVLPDKSGTDLKFITYNGRKYGVVTTYLNALADSYADGVVSVVDMSFGMSVCYLPEVGLGGTRNTSRRSSICAEVNGDGYLYVWVNVPFQGAACYRLGNNCVIGDETLYENVWTKYGVFSNKIDVDDYILFSPKLTNEYGITLGAEVDLGLSVNWSGWDLGATSAMEYGVHFAWGELIPRIGGFDNDGYLHYNPNTYVQNFIGEEISGTDYDAARYHLGEGWRMPTKAEADELLQKCKWVYTVANNIPGYKVIGPNGNSIFLPLNGHIVGDELIDDGVHCCYWTGSLVIYSDGSHSNTNANVLLYGPKEKKTETVIDNRMIGHCIRPVKSKE
ncbi:MAG: hypothetical protein E7081_01585 [Bacteroidales bacterium]|nr:hypothetical protein [Bacteroidales bacterium]